MQRRDILFGALGIAMSGTAYANANQPGPKTRHAYTDYPALRGYVDSLRPIPGGKYETGHMALRSDEKPVQSVARSAFRMGLSPVTFGVWKEYCAATDTALPAAPLWGILGDHHVVNVSWIDIMGADATNGSPV
jgi:hypothetical protein